jgi:hypothetical protein
MSGSTSSALLLAGLAAAGCAQFRPPGEGGGGGGGGGGTAGGGGAAAACLVRGTPYSYADERGTTIAAEGLRLRGTLAGGGEVYAGVGLSLDPKPFDASRYDGIVFSARRTPGSAAHVRLKVPDVHTDPAGGVCTACYNDFGIPFQVTEEWTRYEVRFADLGQETGWGEPRPAAIDASKLYGVQWQVAVAGAEVDLAIRDVAFLGCP